MGGGVVSKHADDIAEFISQKGKPTDASDVTSLDAALVEIQKLRGLTQHLDIHDFDDYVRSKHRSLDKSTDLSQRQPSDKYLSEKKDSHDGINSPKAQSTSNRIISATDALHNCADVNHIAQAVKVKLDHRFVSLDEAFKKLDVKQTGYVSKQEFLDACWYWGVQLQETDFAIITAEAGDGGTGRNDGRIDYSSFIKLMSRITHAEYPVGATHKEIEYARMNQDVGEILRSRVLDSGLTMKQCFREFDKDNSRFIEREEMVNVLKSLNVPFTNEQLDNLFNDFDFNGDGKFQYSEFVRLIQNN